MQNMSRKFKLSTLRNPFFHDNLKSSLTLLFKTELVNYIKQSNFLSVSHC